LGVPNTVQVIKTEEKESDVALATYLIVNVCRRDCDTVVLITNDSDLREPSPRELSNRSAPTNTLKWWNIHNHGQYPSLPIGFQ
jgi:hypothetical protein